ncbi:HVA22-like protein [Quillaja saponaria]|uniref:HVA22-like protein n=1 Tax=Quillaja saponaria TaxID=32244 RepID=A0AAD7PV11_QUISA|nr:HVA22-like protein [Quillaja saponaria]
MGFLKLAINFVDLLGWPLLALGYPLCASIRAIETDSNSDTRNLISYWILLSLIYLFEHAFMKLLQWLWFWPYIKLMIIFLLVIPHFEGAFYVYNHLLHPCTSMNAQMVIMKCRSWKELLVKRENFIIQAEKYIEDNGSDGLEKLIASKLMNTASDLYEVKAVPSTEKKEVYQSNGERLNTEKKDTYNKNIEQIDIKDLGVIEQKEVPVGKHDGLDYQKLLIQAKSSPITLGSLKEANLAQNENLTSSKIRSNEKAGKDAACTEHPDISASKNVQKEWTCAICQVKTTSEMTLNCHLQGRIHRVNCEALKAKNLRKKEPEKTVSNGGLKPTTIKDQKVKVKANQKGLLALPVEFSNELKQKTVINHEKGQGQQKNQGKEASGKNHLTPSLRCNICNVTFSSFDMASHLNGRKHLGQVQLLTG